MVCRASSGGKKITTWTSFSGCIGDHIELVGDVDMGKIYAVYVWKRWVYEGCMCVVLYKDCKCAYWYVV